MFDYILYQEFYGNTIGAWAQSLFLVVLSVIGGRALYIILDKILRRLTAKTKNGFDDFVIDVIEQPLIAGAVLVGVWYSLQTLNMTDSIKTFIYHVFHFLIAFNITWFVAKAFNGLMRKYLAPIVEESENQFDDFLFPFVRKIFNALIWVLGIIVAMDNAGYDVGAVLAGLGIGGIAVAMAAKDTVANLIGAVTILIDRPFVVGDNVIVKGYNSIVREIGMRNTKLELKYVGQILIVPNSDIVNAHVINITQEPSRMYENIYRLELNTPVTRIEWAMEQINKVIKEHEYTMPKIMTFYHVADNTIDITARFWVKHECKKTCFDYSEVRSQINSQILTIFQANDLRLMEAYPRKAL